MVWEGGIGVGTRAVVVVVLGITDLVEEIVCACSGALSTGEVGTEEEGAATLALGDDGTEDAGLITGTDADGAETLPVGEDGTERVVAAGTGAAVEGGAGGGGGGKETAGITGRAAVDGGGAGS